MKSTTSHPESSLDHHIGRSTLKSYSSSPSLVIDTTSSDLKESEFLQDLEESCSSSPFFNPLYKVTHSDRNNHPHHNFGVANGNNRVIIPRTGGGGAKSKKSSSSTGSGSSTSGIALSADDDSQSDRSRSSLSNLVSYSPSPPPPNTSTHNNSPLVHLQNRSSTPSPDSSHPALPISPSISPLAHLRRQIVSRSARPSGILQKVNSLTDFSEEDYLVYTVGGGEGVVNGTTGSGSHAGRSLTGSPYGVPDGSTPSPTDCVLVEVIRKPAEVPFSSCLNKPPKSNKSNEFRPNSCKKQQQQPSSSQQLSQAGLLLVEKRHSVGEIEPALSSKFAGVKVEGSPGKVARIKESIKKYGRFGRTHSEKVLRFKSDSDIDEKNDKKLKDEERGDSGHEKSGDSKPTLRKRSFKLSEKKEDEQLQHDTVASVSEGHEKVRASDEEPKPQKGASVGDTNNENQSTETDAPTNAADSSTNIGESCFDDNQPKSSPNSAKESQSILCQARVFEVLRVSPHVHDNEDEPISSIIGDQDRSMPMLHIHPVPTIDIDNSCITSRGQDEEDFPVLHNTNALIDKKVIEREGKDVLSRQEETVNNLNFNIHEENEEEVGQTKETTISDESSVLQSEIKSEKSEEETVASDMMFRRNVVISGDRGSGASVTKMLNKLGGSVNTNGHSLNIDPTVGVYNRHVKGAGGLNHFFPSECANSSSVSSSLVPEIDDHRQRHDDDNDASAPSTNKKKIGHGKYSRPSNGN
jgi:hypothetical protein